MTRIAASVPFAVVTSLVLVVVGSVLASSDTWAGRLALGVALFSGIAVTGTAIRRHRGCR